MGNPADGRASGMQALFMGQLLASCSLEGGSVDAIHKQKVEETNSCLMDVIQTVTQPK